MKEAWGGKSIVWKGEEPTLGKFPYKGGGGEREKKNLL